MERTEPPEILASDEERERTCALLREACAEGRLTLEECSGRVGQALEARTRGQLREIAHDLPAAPTARMSGPPVSSTVAILSSTEHKGRWHVGERSRVLALLGSCKLDLRNAIISGRVTTINVQVLLGSLDVIVPEGVEVDLDVTPIMGSRTVRLTGLLPVPGAPVVRIVGSIVGGSMTVRDRPRTGERIREKVKEMLE